jgi:FkbM family methyltransferase
MQLRQRGRRVERGDRRRSFRQACGQVVAPALAYAVGAYIRHVPFALGKRFLVHRVFDRHVRWRHLKTITRTRFGARMEVELPDTIQTCILLAGIWEPGVTRYLLDALRPGDTFIDVGANVGYHSLLAASLVGPTGRVVAFEASPTVFRSLQRNLQLNRYRNIDPWNLAISDQAGQVAIFSASEENQGHSTIVPGLAARENQRFETMIRADTLPAAVPASVLYSARIVKIDVEGAERLVIGGISGTLATFGEDTEWIVELSHEFSPGGHDDTNWIFEQFRSHGYRAYRLPNDYSIGPLLDPPRFIAPVRLNSAPTERLVDVVFTKRPESMINRLVTDG